MARRRTPSPDLQKADRAIAAALEGAVRTIATRYPESADLRMAARCLQEFAVMPVVERTAAAKGDEAAL